LKRCYSFAAWLAIIALLIDGLLPTAVSAAVSGNAATHRVLCSVAAGESLPGKLAPTLPTRHCALCVATAVGVFPSGPNKFAIRLLAGAAHPAIAPLFGLTASHLAYASAQPRAPPTTTS
jgi:hypothetical protein